MQNITVEIPENRYLSFVDKMDKLSRRANKIGVGTIEYIYSDPYIWKDAENKVYEFRTFNITFSEIKISDWKIVGKIENAAKVITGQFEVYGKNDPRNKNFLSSVGDNDISEYTHWDCTCEHCNINRERNRLLVLEHENGKRKVVGITCLQDFLGHDVNAILRFYTCIESIKAFSFKIEDAIVNGCSLQLYSKIILAVIEQINKKKFVKFGEEYGVEITSSHSTKYIIHTLGIDYLCSHLDMNTEYIQHHLSEVMNRIEMIVAKEDKTSFEQALTYFSEYDFVPESKVNFLIGLIGRYITEVNKIAEIPFDRSKSNFFGTVGEKVEVKIRIHSASSFESQYGYGMRISGWIDGTNDCFTWFASGNVSEFIIFDTDSQKYIPVKESFDIVATIKDHNANEKFGNSTILTRVKIFVPKAIKTKKEKNKDVESILSSFTQEQLLQFIQKV